MLWKPPHISKTYEALTAIADSRIEITGEHTAKCYSSSRKKWYEVEYNPKTNEINSNDNTAYFTDSVSYPMIGYLLLIGKVKYDQSILSDLQGFYWKEINQKFKNEYDKSVEFVLHKLKNNGSDLQKIESEINSIHDQICKLQLRRLGNKRKPPTGY